MFAPCSHDTTNARQKGVGIAGGLVLLADEPQRVNSAGNPVHYLGVVWAGGFGDPADLHGDVVDVASASGAFLCIRREVWESLGGFNDQYFAYHEDTELSLRAWQRGSRVQFVPSAVARHHYEFSRNPNKQYLLERNRWLTVLTVYPTPLLRLVLPALVMFDVALCIVAFRQGWLAAKLRSWWWLARHRKLIADRRRFVQAESVISVEQFAALLSPRIEPAMIDRPPGLGDHGAGVGWTRNTADTGLEVTGDNVTATGLFVEHYQKNEVIWSGQGRTR